MLTKFQAETTVPVINGLQITIIYLWQLHFQERNKKAVNVSGKYFTMISFGYWIDFHDRISLIWKYFGLLRKNQLVWCSFHIQLVTLLVHISVNRSFCQFFDLKRYRISGCKIFISTAKFSYFSWIG